MRLSISIVATLASLPFSASFAFTASQRQNNRIALFSTNNDSTAETMFTTIEGSAISAPKLSFRKALPDERGKGGIQATESIAALEIIARIPRSLIIATCDSPNRAIAATAEMDPEKFSWAADLTAATLAALFPQDGDGKAVDVDAKQAWIAGWEAGGWATDKSDLGPEDVDWGPKCINGSLLATGSDNDKNVYAKFRFPTHPVVFRAGTGLAMLTGTEEQEALDALLLRGRTFRGMRDALLTLVENPSDRKGSLRERRSWDVADVLSRTLSRATTLQFEGEGTDDDSVGEELSYAVVPIHERLAQCNKQGENSKLIYAAEDNEVLLVATRDIAEGEEITRDYSNAPRLDGDETDGPLRLLLQFGLPTTAGAN
jgi:hypothetical protein